MQIDVECMSHHHRGPPFYWVTHWSVTGGCSTQLEHNTEDKRETFSHPVNNTGHKERR